MDSEPVGAPLEIELDGIIEKPSTDWKKDVIAILDSVSVIVCLCASLAPD
jgi:hypothetical protein